MISQTQKLGRGRGRGHAVLSVAATGTVVIALIAFWLSFSALRSLAIMAGIEFTQSWALPLIIDGLMVVATVAVFALEGARMVWYPWMLLIAAGIVSVVANCLHAVLAAGPAIPTVLATSVASIAPVVHIACTHLTAVLIRHYRRINSATEHTAVKAAVEASGPVFPVVATPTADSGQNLAVSNVPARGDEDPEKRNIGQPEDDLHDAPDREAVVPGKKERRVVAAGLSAAGWSNKKIARSLAVWPSTVGRWLTPPTEELSGDAAHTDVEDTTPPGDDALPREEIKEITP